MAAEMLAGWLPGRITAPVVVVAGPVVVDATVVVGVWLVVVATRVLVVGPVVGGMLVVVGAMLVVVQGGRGRCRGGYGGGGWPGRGRWRGCGEPGGGGGVRGRACPPGGCAADPGRRWGGGRSGGGGRSADGALFWAWSGCGGRCGRRFPVACGGGRCGGWCWPGWRGGQRDPGARRGGWGWGSRVAEATRAARVAVVSPKTNSSSLQAAVAWRGAERVGLAWASSWFGWFFRLIGCPAKTPTYRVHTT